MVWPPDITPITLPDQKFYIVFPPANLHRYPEHPKTSLTSKTQHWQVWLWNRNRSPALPPQSSIETGHLTICV